MYVQINNGIVVRRFANDYEVRREFPNIAFPQVLTNVELDGLGIYELLEGSIPSYDPMSENLIEIAPALIGSSWTRQWHVETASPEEIQERYKATVPEMVTRAQGKVALIQAGLWNAVVSAVDAIVDPVEKEIALVALNDTVTWQRNSPFLNQMAEALDISEQAMDALFIAAAQINL